MTKSLKDLKPGDPVVRFLAGTVRHDLVVTEVRGDRIICGDWEFDSATGAEIDEYLGWDSRMTGSFIKIEDGA